MKIALFTSAALLALGLAACGGGEPAAPVEPAPVAETAPEPAPTPEVAPASAMGETPADVPAFMKARHEKYEDLGKNFKVVMDNNKSGSPDMAAVTAAAAKIKGYADEMGTWFPPGTAAEPGKEGAKPNIWTDRATFDAALAKFQGEATKLAAVTDAAGLKVQFPATGGTCKNCHDTFREEHKDK
jgi:cytochrome c556